jgi:Ca-activated chloride channel family protein
VSFIWPLALIALLIVPLAALVALWLERRPSRYPVRFTNIDVLATVASPRRSWRGWIPPALFLIALASAATAVARPRASVSEPAEQATVVLLVDVSGSMRADDVDPTRLGAAQRAMHAFVDRLPGAFRIGLVSFSTTPDVVVQPTRDRALIGGGLDSLYPEQGTAIGDGLAEAVRVTAAAVRGAPRRPGGNPPAAIILLSDGAQTRGALSPLDGAARARRAGIPVYTVALGTPNGVLGLGPNNGFGLPPSPGGGPTVGFRVPPDPAILRQISAATGGRAYTAQTASKVQSIYEHLGSIVVSRRTTREVSSWFAGLAAVFLLGSVGAARLTAPRLP